MFGGGCLLEWHPAQLSAKTILPRVIICFVLGDIVAAAGRIVKVKWLEPAEEGCDVIKALLRRAPEDRIFLGISDLERFLRRQSD